MTERFRSRAVWAVVGALTVSLLVAAGCGGSSKKSSSSTNSGSGSSGVSLSNCSAPVGSGKYTVVSDLPLQGASRLQTCR